MHDSGNQNSKIETDRILEARDRINKWIIRGSIKGHLIPEFISGMKTFPTRLPSFPALMIPQNGEYVMYYDYEFVNNVDPTVYDYLFAHEIHKYLADHYGRGQLLMEKHRIPEDVFYKAYFRYFDILIFMNSLYLAKPLIEHPGLMTSLKAEEEIGLKIRESTVEGIFQKLHSHYQTVPDALNRILLNIRVRRFSQDAEFETGTFLYPDLSNPVNIGSAEEHLKSLIDMAKDSYAGNDPGGIRNLLGRFKTIEVNKTSKVMNSLERILIGVRNMTTQRERKFSRLSRRLRIPPGHVTPKGFRLTVIADESGSMSDDEFNFALNIVKQVSVNEKNDRVYVVHWDTGPSDIVDEISNPSQVVKIKRLKSGGTNFSEIFTHKIVSNLDTDAIVVITDGYPSVWPSSIPRVPTIWAITTEGGVQSYLTFRDKTGRNIGSAVYTGSRG